MAQRRAVGALLDAAGSDVERAWLLRALAAGNAVAALAAFAGAIRGRGEPWLRERLRPLDPHRFDAGRGVWCGAVLAQSTPTTCGSMSLLLTRAMHDPVYALALAAADGDMAARLAAEERRIHRETSRLRIEGGAVRWWPGRFGTAPAHAAAWLSRRTGTAYEVAWVGYGLRTPTNVDRGVAGAGAGDPALLLIGNGYPDHYVMVVGRDGAGVRVYNPAGGAVVTVQPERLRREPLTWLNRSKLYAVVTAR